MTEGHKEFPKVVAITLNWNGMNDTIECIASLKKQGYPNYQIIVVDNGSTDGSVRALRAQYPDLTILDNGRNLGYAAGFNVGLRHAYKMGTDYFLILNNDTIVAPDALAELVKAAEQDDQIGFVSGKVYWHDKPDTFQTAGRYNDAVTLVGPHVGSGEVDRGQHDTMQDYDFIDDVFLLVRRQVYEKVGGYDPLFFLYYEETDWCVRVRRAGFRIVYAPLAKIWHKGLVGNANLPLTPKRIFYLQRYEIPFIQRNASSEQWRAYVRRLLVGLPYKLLRYAKHGRFRAMLAYFKGVSCGVFWVWRNAVVRRMPDRPNG